LNRLGRQALPATLFTLLLLAVYSDPLFTRRNFVGRDLVLYGLPLEKDVHDAWARGRWPVWSENISGGRPLFPNPNAGALHPVRPLLSRLPFPVAMRLFPPIHWALAGAGMLVLLRALAASVPAAWVGAATYAFSGVIVSEVFYLPNAPAAALHPWILWAVVRPAASAGRKAVVLGLVYGLLFLIGDAFAVVVALFASVLWIGLEVERTERRREIGTLLLGLVLAGLLAAPQIVATSLLVPETRRAVMGIPLREVVRFTLSPWRLLELAVPYPFGDVWTLEDSRAWSVGVSRGLFLTLYCGAFAVLGLAALWRSRERGARFARTLFVAGALLAMSGTLLPSGWGEQPSPIPLRFPEKFAVAVVFALAVASGLAFDRFRRDWSRSAWPLGVGIGFAAAAVAAWLFPLPAGMVAVRAIGASAGVASEAGRHLAGALAEAGILWMVTVVALDLLRGSGAARLFACLALLTAIPIAANRRIARTESEASVFPPTVFARAIARRDPAADFRTVDSSSYVPASPLSLAALSSDPYLTESARRNWSFLAPDLWGRGTVFNVDPDRGDLSRLESLRRVSVGAMGASHGPVFFSALALRFGIRYRDQKPLPGFRRFGGDALQDWDENPTARPAIRLLERWREEPGALQALVALPGLEGGEVVLETGRRASGTARPATLRFVENSPERLLLATSGPDPTWLFALRGYWAHRTVRVDGAEVETSPAQLAFTAVPVPAGSHRVEWREEVPGLRLSRLGPALFALVAVGLCLPRRAADRPA
jgi:hypothetical protein